MPIGVDRLNDSSSPSAFLNENPDLAKVPPRDTAATKLCIAILNEMYPVNSNSF